MKKYLGVVIGLVVAYAGISLNSTVWADYSGTFEVEANVIGFSERFTTMKEYRPVKECREVQVRQGGSTSSDTPELLGAILGGAIGKEIDDDSKASVTIGALLGASIASDIEKKQAAGKGSIKTEVRCTTIEREVETQRLDGYNVAYEYAGHVFRATTPTRPGTTIKVKIIALPVDYTE